jgi:hypothetical protein
MVDISFLILNGPFPLENVQIRLWSEDGSTFVTSGSTDASGELTLDVPEARYSIRCFKTGFSFPSHLQLLAEEGALFQIEANDLNTHPPSTLSHACRVSGYAMDATGSPLEGATFEFKLTDYGRIAAQRFAAAPKVIVLSDPTGKVDVHLLRNAVYDTVVESQEDKVIRVRVPDSSSVDITELIWPRILTFNWSVTVVEEVSIGEKVTVTAEPVLSNGNALPYDLDNGDSVTLDSLIEVVSSDLDIAAATLSGNTLTLQGVGVGIATISFKAKAGGLLYRLDEDTLPDETIHIEVE